MRIHQLSVTFQPEEDRLLLRVSTETAQETRLWLTRRLMAGLWPHLERMQREQLLRTEPAGGAAAHADPDVRQALADFRRDAALNGADFATPYREPEHRPLGESPLLVTDVDLAALADGRIRLGFRERAQAAAAGNGRSLQMDLETALMQGFMQLLDQGLGMAGWRSPFEPAQPALDNTETERPRLLN